jgi:hypothetical protein
MSTLHFEDVIQKAIKDLETRPILEPFVVSDKPSTLTPVLSVNRKLELVRGPTADLDQKFTAGVQN